MTRETLHRARQGECLTYAWIVRGEARARQALFAHRADRRAPAALTKNVPPPRDVDDRAHAEEVRRHLELVDERQLLLELLRHLLRDDVAVATVRAFPREPRQRLHRRLADLSAKVA